MNRRIRSFVDNWKRRGSRPVVDYAVYKPTLGELNNLCYLSMKYLAGWNMRGCDFEVVVGMGGVPESVVGLDDKFIPCLAGYMWDHLLGEPVNPSCDDVMEGVRVVRDMLYSLDEVSRGSV